MPDKAEAPRILLVDDEPDILAAYRYALTPPAENAAGNKLRRLEANLFPERTASRRSHRSAPPAPSLTCCTQGAEAVEAARRAMETGRPFAAVFMDVRMPPGMDGVSAAQAIRAIDKDVNIVIVTAYSDLAPEEIGRRIQPADKLLYLQKPFHPHEIRQFAAALAAKWRAERDLIAMNRDLDRLVAEKTHELQITVEALEKSNQRYRETAAALKDAQAELAAKAEDLKGSNQALQRLIAQNKEERKTIEKDILFTINEMVEPYIDRLEKSGLHEAQLTFIKILRTNLREITAPFMKDLSHRYFRLTPTEIRIAKLIKDGLTTKAIAAELEMTKRNVDFYRDRIREKIGIKNTKANLKSVLRELEMEFQENHAMAGNRT